MEKNLNQKEIILSIIISLFSVIFLWGFWDNGIYSFGFNATVFWLLFIGYFIVGIEKPKEFLIKNFYWITPIIFIILSFSIYENPFLKEINIFLIPISLIFFLGFSITKFEGKDEWNLKMIYIIISRRFYIRKALKALHQNVNKGNLSQIIIKKIIIGIIIFLCLNSVIILLLMGADNRFSEIISNLFKYIDSEIILRAIFAFLILIVITAIKLTRKEEYIMKQVEKQIDSIISGIVLGGTLVTYLLFIWVQIENIFINNLPLNIEDVTNLVKNGFWQLFFISIINIIFFFVYYKKTSDSVQKILIAFILASIIILLSAGNRMFMYVYNYGLSYEKFTASYTVLYFGILFIFMSYILFFKRKSNILKTAVILALWMYSALNVFPTELIIFKTNIVLTNKQNKKINIYQSHMLSADVLIAVNKLKGSKIYERQDWDLWVEKKLKKNKEKKWYEKNIHNF